jgi:hypothetical protein
MRNIKNFISSVQVKAQSFKLQLSARILGLNSRTIFTNLKGQRGGTRSSCWQESLLFGLY